MKNKEFVGVGIAAFIILGLALWFMATHPAPALQTSTGTEQEAQNNEQIIDLQQYYEVRALFPKAAALSASSEAGAGIQAAALMKAWVTDTIDTFKKESGLNDLTQEDIDMQGIGKDDRKYALTIAYTTHMSPSTITYLYEIYANTLGAHPNTYYHSFTFDTSTGINLAIGNLFVPGANYLTKLSQISRAQLPGIIAEREQVAVSEVPMDMIEDGTKPVVESFQTFYVEGDNLVIVFSPYAVGPYVLGTVEFPVPLSQLSDILKPGYKVQ
ncbi:MAG: hypothetical protein JWN64_644 [Parcubacteria group bacterium]|nr:hypothetical protein [Parcubacteria group bacterium]